MLRRLRFVAQFYRRQQRFLRFFSTTRPGRA
jgi:hypothetical protein